MKENGRQTGKRKTTRKQGKINEQKYTRNKKVKPNGLGLMSDIDSDGEINCPEELSKKVNLEWKSRFLKRFEWQRRTFRVTVRDSEHSKRRRINIRSTPERKDKSTSLFKFEGIPDHLIILRHQFS